MKDKRERLFTLVRQKLEKSRSLLFSGWRFGSASPGSYVTKHVADLDYLVTRDEREALIVENSLIKKYKPKFNLQLKTIRTMLLSSLKPAGISRD